MTAKNGSLRLDALFPQGVLMLGRLDHTSREPAHVVVTAWGVGIWSCIYYHMEEAGVPGVDIGAFSGVQSRVIHAVHI